MPVIKRAFQSFTFNFFRLCCYLLFISHTDVIVRFFRWHNCGLIWTFFSNIIFICTRSFVIMCELRNFQSYFFICFLLTSGFFSFSEDHSFYMRSQLCVTFLVRKNVIDKFSEHEAKFNKKWSHNNVLKHIRNAIGTTNLDSRFIKLNLFAGKK